MMVDGIKICAVSKKQWNVLNNYSIFSGVLRTTISTRIRSRSVKNSRTQSPQTKAYPSFLPAIPSSTVLLVIYDTTVVISTLQIANVAAIEPALAAAKTIVFSRSCSKSSKYQVLQQCLSV